MNASDLVAKRRPMTFDQTAPIFCLVIAALLRLGVILSQPEQLTVDRDAYLGIATSVAEGRGYSSPNSSTPTAFRPPLYPLLLAAGFRLLTPAVAVAGINLLAGLLAVGFVASIGKRLQLGRLRFVAALLVAVDPLLLQYSSRPMTESICTALTAFWLWALVASWPLRASLIGPCDDTEAPGGGFAHDAIDGRAKLPLSREAGTRIDSAARREPRPPEGYASYAHGLLIGIAFGLLVLSRPTFWPIAGFYVIVWLVLHRRNLASRVCFGPEMASGVWSVVGTAIVVAPWLIRNWLIFGVPILTTTHGGYTLLLGNNPVFYDQVVRQKWGTIWPEDSQRKWEADRKARVISDLGGQVTELQEDAWNSREAKRFIADEPVHCAEAVVHRIRSLWNTTPQGEAADGVNRWFIAAVGWYYAVVLFFNFAGMALVLIRHDRVRWMPFYVLIVSVQLVHLMYWTNTRMRAPLTPAIALFAVVAMSRVVSSGGGSGPGGSGVTNAGQAELCS